MDTPKTEEMVEYRCFATGNLLCKASGEGQIEIMNPRNRQLNYTGPSRANQDIGPKGNDFLRYAADFNCRKCKRLLGRGLGLDMLTEIKCRYCHELNLYDLKEMQRVRYGMLAEVQRNSIHKEIKKLISPCK